MSELRWIGSDFERFLASLVSGAANTIQWAIDEGRRLDAPARRDPFASRRVATLRPYSALERRVLYGG